MRSYSRIEVLRSMWKGPCKLGLDETLEPWRFCDGSDIQAPEGFHKDTWSNLGLTCSV